MRSTELEPVLAVLLLPVALQLLDEGGRLMRSIPYRRRQPRQAFPVSRDELAMRRLRTLATFGTATPSTVAQPVTWPLSCTPEEGLRVNAINRRRDGGGDE